MNILNYPLPLDNWPKFHLDVVRFTRTLWEFDAGEDYRLRVMCAWGVPDEYQRKLFGGIPTDFITYDGPGLDTGSAQFSADQMTENNFMVCFTTRHYFWKDGWLKRLCDARREFGPGLYGICANRETYPLHLCLRCFGIDSDDFKRYPFHINSKVRCHEWEVYYALKWMRSLGHATKLVAWDGVWDELDWFTRPNRWRHGDQSNLLVWDAHSDHFAQADEAEKQRLIRLNDGIY
jgi:hypothetical protein